MVSAIIMSESRLSFGMVEVTIGIVAEIMVGTVAGIVVGIVVVMTIGVGMIFIARCITRGRQRITVITTRNGWWFTNHRPQCIITSPHR
jgi:hypothetical protein